MNIVLWAVLGLVGLTILLVVLDLVILKGGLIYQWKEAPDGPYQFRVRYKHWLPRWFRSTSTADMEINDQILSADGQFSAHGAAHEVGHGIRARRMGRWKYLWKYITNAEFRAAEEIWCNNFADEHMNDPVFKAISRIKKG